MNASVRLPQVYCIRQQFEGPTVDDIPGAVKEELGKLDLVEKIRPGETVAITGGSRGIANIDTILKAVADQMKALGARPFIIPAMGSHGGGTAEGQIEVLARYGVTEQAMSCPIRATMDVVEIGRSEFGIPVFLDRYAAEADHIAVVNRVKLHTKFIGKVESGLMKMCLIGLGKREGARAYHRAIDRHSWDEIVGSVAGIVREKAPIAFGLAILENAFEQTARLAAVRPEDFPTVEPELLKQSADMMAQLPFHDVDLLIVDEMGKDISGTGMDTNITGRKDNSPMQVLRLFVRDLTEKTHGNAQGIGLADFTTRRLASKIDFRQLYINSQTAYRTDTPKVPMTFDTDREVINVAMDMIGLSPPEDAKIVWIKNTLELADIIVSEAYLSRVAEHDNLTVVGGPFEIEFDSEGNLARPPLRSLS